MNEKKSGIHIPDFEWFMAKGEKFNSKNEEFLSTSLKAFPESPHYISKDAR